MLPQSQKRPAAPETITIRPAVVADVPAISRLVLANAIQGKVLPRSAEAIETMLADWIVACADDQILGCVSLLRYTSGLVEVRSLVVEERYQELRIGSKLIEALLVEARRRQIQTLFALTRRVAFFERFGFRVSERSRFPEKVWQDCTLCPLVNNCDETAMVLEIAAA